jgi:hypothetical protein
VSCHCHLLLFKFQQFSAYRAGAHLTSPCVPAPLAPDNFNAFLTQCHPLNQQLHDALSFGREQLLPNLPELAKWQNDFDIHKDQSPIFDAPTAGDSITVSSTGLTGSLTIACRA